MIVVPTARGMLLGATACLVGDGEERLQAWAERFVRPDPDLKWILGNYVEADNANDNGHIFPRGELAAAQSTLAGKPLNMMHREHYIVGAFAGAQLLTADGGEVAASNSTSTSEAWGERPYVEALAGMWHNRFPEEFFQVKRAHSEGSLFFSMECLPESVSCPTCDHASPYAGFSSESYCDHMQGAVGPKILHKPTFNGGAIIIPPIKPGWSRADITAISKYLAEEPEQAEQVYEEAAMTAPHLGPTQWETMMHMVVTAAGPPPGVPPMMPKGMMLAEGKMPMMNRQDVAMAVKAAPDASDPAAAKERVKKAAQKLKCQDLIPPAWMDAATAREFAPATREKMAKKGTALPDGSFPIANEQDLHNAIQAIGRAKDPAATKAHIKKRANALGLSKLLPKGW